MSLGMKKRGGKNCGGIFVGQRGLVYIKQGG